MSQAPPPFRPDPYKRKSNTGLIIGIVAACIIIPCGACGIFGYWFWGKAKSIGACLVDFEDVRKGIYDYTGDHNGKLPDAAKWQDEVRSYFAKNLKPNDRRVLGGMDPNGIWSCHNDGSETGIAFNSDLSGKAMKDIKDPYSTALIFEIPSPAMNANEPYKVNTSPSPKMFGNERGWIVADVEGPVSMPTTGVQFRSTSGADNSNGELPHSSGGTSDSGGNTAKPDSSTTSGATTAGVSKPTHKPNGVDDE